MTRSKWKALSSLFTNFASIFLASLVIPVITGNIDLSQWYVIVLGMTGTSAFSWLSLISAEKGRL